MTIGQKIKNLRKEGRVTQEEFADRLNVSRQSVSKWENDQACPETETVIRIAEFFGVSCDYLLKDGGEAECAYAGRKLAGNFRTGSFLAFCTVLFACFLGVLLSFAIQQTDAPVIAFAVEAGLIFAAVCAYVAVRNYFFVRAAYTDGDQHEISKATSRMIYAVAIAIAAVLPLVVFRLERVFTIQSPEIGGVGTEITTTMRTPLYFYEYLIFLPAFALGGFLIAASIDLIRRRFAEGVASALLVPTAVGALVQAALGFTLFFAYRETDIFTYTEGGNGTAPVSAWVWAATALLAVAEPIFGACRKRTRARSLIPALCLAALIVVSSLPGLSYVSYEVKFACFVAASVTGIALLTIGFLTPMPDVRAQTANQAVLIVMFAGVGLSTFLGTPEIMRIVYLVLANVVSLAHGVYYAFPHARGPRRKKAVSTVDTPEAW